MEWEIVNYPPSLEEEDGEADEKTRLGWILSTGLSLGRKLVITGVVVSSVPLVLPSLVVISALGFAFSVPFGVVFASYACTQKLMSELLPPPVLPHTEEEEELVPAHVDVEEKQEREAIKDGVEMRIELVDDYDAGLRDDVGNEQESGLASRGEFTDHEVRYLEGENDEFLSINVKDGGVDKEETEQYSVEDEKPISFNVVGTDTGNGDNAMKTDDHAVGAQELGDAAQDGAEFTLPISRVETDNFVEDEGKKNIENRERILEEKDEQVENIVTGVKGKEKDKKPRTVSEGKSSAMEMKTVKKENFDSIKVPHKRKEPNGDRKHEELSGKKKELLEETRTSSEDNVNLRKVNVERQKFEVVGQETSVDERSSVSSKKEQAGEEERIIMPGNEDLDDKQVVLEGNVDGSIEKEQKPMSLNEMCEDDAAADVSYMMNKGTKTSPGMVVCETAECMFDKTI